MVKKLHFPALPIQHLTLRKMFFWLEKKLSSMQSQGKIWLIVRNIYCIETKLIWFRHTIDWLKVLLESNNFYHWHRVKKIFVLSKIFFKYNLKMTVILAKLWGIKKIEIGCQIIKIRHQGDVINTNNMPLFRWTFFFNLIYCILSNKFNV